ELIDCAFQGAGQRAAIKADADSLDPVIGAEGQDHDRPGTALLLDRPGERLVLGNVQDLRPEARDLHGISPLSPSPAVRERVASAASRVRVFRTAVALTRLRPAALGTL